VLCNAVSIITYYIGVTRYITCHAIHWLGGIKPPSSDIDPQWNIKGAHSPLICHQKS